MGSENPVVFNPKDNNRSLLITTVTKDGREIKLATLKPGESFRSDRKSFSIREIPAPAKLEFSLQEDGTFGLAPE